MKPGTRLLAGTLLALAVCAGMFNQATHAQTRGGGAAGAGGRGDGGIAGGGIPGIPQMTTQRVVSSGIIRPIFVTYAPGDPTRLFIIEKRGLIRVLKIDVDPPVLLGTPFLDLDSVIAGGTSQGSEQGLLGLAFHPKYQQNGTFYVYYTGIRALPLAGSNTVARFQVSGNPDVAVGSNTTGSVVLEMDDAESNHNGGWIAFKPGDTLGYLYVAIGDGGGGNDAHGANGNGQNLNTLFGKILRLDIDGLDNVPGNADDDALPANTSRNYSIPSSNPFASIAGEDEIWAYGLRNPSRCSFDRTAGDMYIGDVGQDAWEEIDFEPGNSLGGRNYGWRCMEANHCTGLSGCTCNLGCGAGLLTCPIYEYANDPNVCAVTGGYVYRGARMPLLHGTYFFADYHCSIGGGAPIWSFKYVGGLVTNFQNRTAELDPPDLPAPPTVILNDTLTSFGEDYFGELYMCDQEGGEIFKIIPVPCYADIVPTGGDGSRDVNDLLAVINTWGPCSPHCVSDIVSDGEIDVNDLLAVINNWGSCP